MSRPPVKVDIAFDSSYSTAAASRTWTDVTDYVLTGNGITNVYGRQDELSQPGPNTCSLTLNNSDGRFTPGLASGAYYPNVKVGRPIRVASNLCSFGDGGSFELNADDWTGNNATVQRTTAQSHSGSASLEVTATAPGNMSANTPGSTSGIPVLAGQVYRASAWYRRGATSRTCDLRVVWSDSGGVTLTTDTSPTTVGDTLTWQKIEFEVTAPASAAFARVRPFIAAPVAAEIHYVDDVRLDVDRFTGYVDEWPVEWPSAVSGFATSTITAASRMARLGLSDPRRSVIEEEYLLDNPDLYYTMGEAEGSLQANDSSGNSAAPLVVKSAYVSDSFTTVAPTFGTAIGPDTDGLTAVEFPHVISASNSQQLRARISGTNRGFDFFVSRTGTLTNTRVIFGIGGLSSGNQCIVTLEPPNGLQVNVNGTFLTYTGTIGVDTVKHVAVRQNGANVELYVNGVLDVTAAATLPAYDFLAVGDFDQPYTTNTVVIAHLGVYSTAPTAARFLAHSDAGRDGFYNETAQTRLERYAGYAGVPSAEYSISTAADTRMAHIDTTGKGCVELMQTVATTDGGVLYDSTRGLLTYTDREVRYNAATALTLDVSAGEVEVGYTPKLDRSALINKLTATLSDGTYSVTAENTTSTADYGVHGPGDLELAATSQNDAHAAAWWKVTTYGEPAARAPQLGVELGHLSATRQAAILAVKVSDEITVTNLPAQSDAATKSFFVEGWTETITDSQHRIDFNVSPTTGFDVWEIGHATFGQYDAYPIAY